MKEYHEIYENGGAEKDAGNHTYADLWLDVSVKKRRCTIRVTSYERHCAHSHRQIDAIGVRSRGRSNLDTAHLSVDIL